ncbi:hypothetical protein [Thalassotalea fusca]
MSAFTKPSPIHLLVTARDPATAQSFAPVLERLHNDDRFIVSVILQSPASEMLTAKAERYWHVSDEHGAIEQLSTLHDSLPIQVILVGVSGPDTGIDEVTLAFAESHNIPTHAYQGFWGDFNQQATSLPQFVFALDQLAVRVNQQRLPNVQSYPVGSLKHIDFEHVDAVSRRSSRRANLGLHDEILVGFYGQPLDTNNGYLNTVDRFIEHLALWDKPFVLMYRAHPKESQALQNRTWAKMNQHLPNHIIRDSSSDIVDSICGCDLVVSAFSTCGIDNVYLNRHANEALNASVFLWFEQELIDWWKNYSEMTDMPLTGEQGLIHSVEDIEHLHFELENALSHRAHVRQRAIEQLPCAKQAIDTIIQVLKKNALKE